MKRGRYCQTGGKRRRQRKKKKKKTKFYVIQIVDSHNSASIYVFFSLSHSLTHCSLCTVLLTFAATLTSYTLHIYIVCYTLQNYILFSFYSIFFSSVFQQLTVGFFFADNLANRHSHCHHHLHHARICTICFTIIIMYTYINVCICICIHIRIKHRRVAKLFVWYELESLGASNP